MKIVICASLDFTNQIKEMASQLADLGHAVEIPKTSEAILNGEMSLEQIMTMKEKGEISKRMIALDVIRYYFNKIKESEAILVLNYEKKGIKNYIGGNTFLEIGFAHVLDKKIFLLNDIPDISYKDEIKAMQPIVLNGDLNLIR